MPDQVVHDLAGLRVERTERLVHEQYLRARHERPGDGRPLLHAPGELIRISVGRGFQTHDGQQRIRAAGRGFDVRGGDALALCLEPTGELDVLHHGQPGIEL